MRMAVAPIPIIGGGTASCTPLFTQLIRRPFTRRCGDVPSVLVMGVFVTINSTNLFKILFVRERL